MISTIPHTSLYPFENYSKKIHFTY